MQIPFGNTMETCIRFSEVKATDKWMAEMNLDVCTSMMTLSLVLVLTCQPECENESGNMLKDIFNLEKRYRPLTKRLETHANRRSSDGGKNIPSCFGQTFFITLNQNC